MGPSAFPVLAHALNFLVPLSADFGALFDPPDPAALEVTYQPR